MRPAADAEHYNTEDRRRTRPILERAIEAMLPAGADAGPWTDLDNLTAHLALRPGQAGTVKSKLRELNDVHHTHLGLRLESRRVEGGRWQYRVVKRKPEQLPLSLRENHAPRI